MITIRSVDNGYILKTHVSEFVFENIEDLFSKLLLILTGKCKNFTGCSYGNVIIENINDEDCEK